MRTRLFRTLAPLVLVTAALLGSAACGDNTSAAPVPPTTAQQVPQDAGHARLNQLVGEWTAEKSTFVAGGTPENPIVTRDAVSRWSWVAETGGNFLREEVTGTFGDRPYYRLGLLGYSPVDDRYEWSTFDSVTPLTMAYRGAKGSANAPELSMTGEFTDPGITGPANVGKSVPMRTVIRLESSDRTVMELYFTPPGEPERLADRVVLTRLS
ncbi:DUF1579 family protein [Nocardia rosealba]|uniref:DUF1579 family protein n=1 Tax=Nocardia rosealba TaxID=2878563 RepID=UPI001CDA52E8|nr:DUF1579 family protein [Nocardia rosealba]MCA2211044.1 DUF1579 domain-containing protein [Nocardia rosealba]